MTASTSPATSGGHAKRELRVLGSTEVRTNGVTSPLRPRERHVLAALALRHPQPTPLDEIIELLWTDHPPSAARQAVQNHIARLRQSLGDDAVETEPSGYRLGRGWHLDVAQFDAALERAGRAVRDADHPAARVQLRRALALRRGEAFADLGESEAVAVIRARRNEQQQSAEEQLALAELAAGELTTAITDASSLAASEPFRELRWAILSLALYRDGQRRESLAALERARLLLRDEAGLDPGLVLRTLERRILNDDPALITGSVWALLDTVHTSTDLEPRPLFVGRRDLLAKVRRTLADVADTRSVHPIRITGSSGVGKSAFAEQVAEQAALDGFDVAVAVCRSTPSEFLEPWGEVVRVLLAHEANPLDVHGVEALQDLGFGEDLSDNTDRLHGNVAAVVAEIIVEHALHRPTLLVIDDAHLLTPSARHILGAVSGSSAPLAIVTVTGHIDESELAPGTTLELTGLEPAEFAQLLTAIRGADVAANLGHVLHLASDGNPRALRRLLEDAPTNNLSSVVEPGRIVRAAFDRFGPRIEAIARLLALHGAPLRVELIADALPSHKRTDIDEALAQGRLAGIFRSLPHEEVDVGEGLTRAAVLDTLTDDERKDLHERLARVLANEGLTLMAAWHVLAAPERFGEAEVDLLADVAQSASRATMYLEAAGFLDGAVTIAERELGADHTRTLTMLLDKAEHLRRGGDKRWIEIAWEAVRRAEAADAHDMLAFGLATLCQVGPLIRSGSVDHDLAAAVERALARPLSPLARSACAGQATLLLSLSGNISRCRELFDVALSSAQESGNAQALLSAYGNVYVALAHPNDWRQAATLSGEMLVLAEDLDDIDGQAAALHSYFAVQVRFGDPLLRTTFVEQAKLAARLRSSARLWMVGYQRACLAFLDGKLEESVAISHENATRSPMDTSRTTSTHLMHLLAVRMAQERSSELTEMLDAATEDQSGVPGWRAVISWPAALRGDRDRVLAECDALDCGRALPHDMTWSGATMLLGRAVATTGDPERCSKLIELLAPWTGFMTWYGSGTVGPFDLALAELSLAVGDHAAARRYEAAAKRVVSRLRAVVYEPDLIRLAARLGG